MGTGKNKDQDLHDYLKGKSDVSRAYQSHSRETPPAHIDEAILAAARRGTGARPGKGTGPFAHNWRVPASLAAVLVLGVGLVLFTAKETGEPMLEPLEEVVTPVIQKNLDADYTRGREKELNDISTEPVRSRAARQSPASLAAPAPVTAPAKAKQKKAGKLEYRKLMKEGAPPVLETRPAAGASGLSADEYKPVEQKSYRDQNKTSPKDWLAQIRALYKQGRKKEADKSLAAFRKAYPDYPLDNLHK